MPDTISLSPSHSVLPASDWVRRWSHLVPQNGSVLDVACGAGRHMQWFAGRGHTAIGVDRSPEAVEAARQFGELVSADIENGPWPFADRRFDAIVVTNYLWRPLFPHLLDSVAPGGVLIYETFAIGNESVGRPARAEFLLQPGELLTLCPGLRVIAYEDGFLPEPARFVQRIVARRETSPSTEVFRAQLCAPV